MATAEKAVKIGKPKRFARTTSLLVRLFVSIGMLPVLLIVMIALFGYLNSRFVSQDNLLNVMRQSTYLIIISVGQMIVLISGGFDLSVGAVVALTSVLSARAMADVGGSPASAILIGILVGLGVGVVVGLLNGVAVSLLKVSPFIVTLGTASIGTGVALLLTGGAPVVGLPDWFINNIGVGRIGGIPTPLYITAGLIVLMYFVIARMRLGRYIYAIGGNEQASRLSGLPIARILVTVYVLSGALAALAGILLTARVSSGAPDLGAPFVLQSITAAVLGGVSLRGGEGKLSGVVLGALFIAFLGNGMNLVNISSYWQNITLGIILIFAVLMDRLREGLNRAS